MHVPGWLDDALGAMDWIDRLEGVITRLRWRDPGHGIAMTRADKGGTLSGVETEETLRRYGVRVCGRGFDSRRLYFMVKRRQARWAEYLLLRAGVPLENPLHDPRVAAQAARHAGLPPAWADRARRGWWARLVG